MCEKKIGRLMQPAPVDVDLTLSPRQHPGGFGTLKLEDYACVVHVSIVKVRRLFTSRMLTTSLHARICTVRGGFGVATKHPRA